MKTATKVVYLAILVVVSAVPIIIWSQDPSIDLAGVGGVRRGARGADGNVDCSNGGARHQQGPKWTTLNDCATSTGNTPWSLTADDYRFLIERIDSMHQILDGKLDETRAQISGLTAIVTNGLVVTAPRRPSGTSGKSRRRWRPRQSCRRYLLTASRQTRRGPRRGGDVHR
jgi:hypothetical protein